MQYTNADVHVLGNTQPGFAGTPLIEVNGSGAGAGAHGFSVIASDVEVRSLSIFGWSLTGIVVSGDNAVIMGNYIGLRADGTTALGNAASGVGISLGISKVVIGSATSGDRNVISANGSGGIDTANNVNLVIRGNYIGTDATGLLDRGNGRGISFIQTYGSIGGSGPGEGNVISGNSGDGIEVDVAGSGSPGGVTEIRDFKES